MENHFTPLNPSLDYFSLAISPTELQKSNHPPSAHWDLSPASDIAFQSPPSGESLAVSPVSPQGLPFSGGQYALPLQQTNLDRKADQPLQYNNSAFDDWMQWSDASENVIYPADQSDVVSFKLEPVTPIMEALELSGGVGISQMRATMCNSLDDGSVAFQDNMLEGPLFPAPQEIPLQQNGTFYTGQPGWNPPQPDYGANQPRNRYPKLSTEEASDLIRIAMPPPTTTESTESTESGQQNRSQRKRKSSTSSASSNSSSGSSRPPPRRHSAPKKTAHNMIEKRYRTNLNDKIAALRDSVPSLRVTEKIAIGDAPISEDLQGLEAAHKLNKATILSKATEYIAHLEGRNEDLVKECQGLRDRIDAFEVLLMSRPESGSNSNASSNPSPANYHHQKAKWRQAQHHQQSRN